LMIGQAVDAATYPVLATLLGQAGGFVTIPDMRDRFPAGAGANIGALGAAGGAASVGLTNATLPSHSHGGASGANGVDHVHAFTTDNINLDHVHGRPSGFYYVVSDRGIAATWGSPTQTTAQAYRQLIGGDLSAPAIQSSTDTGPMTSMAVHAHTGTSGASDRSLSHAHTIAADGGSAAHENRPPFKAVNFIIRAG
jgi:microcystin-dependent protein